MRTIPAFMQAKFDGGFTTHCHCWLITRKDGVKLGFTDHDEDITIESTLCKATTGFDRSEVSEKLGFNITGGDVTGALSDTSLNDLDIEKGSFDNAKINQYLVDWQDPTSYILLRTGRIGEIERMGLGFKAEIRSRLTEFDEENGRFYTPSCDANLGDKRCKFTLAPVTKTVVASANNSECVTTTLFEGYQGGRLKWQTGANSGVVVEVHSQNGNHLTLWQNMPQAIEIGDTFILSQGCDKQFSTCHSKFNNALNFQGFPHMPGNDFLTAYTIPGEGS